MLVKSRYANCQMNDIPFCDLFVIVVDVTGQVRLAAAILLCGCAFTKCLQVQKHPLRLTLATTVLQYCIGKIALGLDTVLSSAPCKCSLTFHVID